MADTVSADATVDAGSVDAGIPLHKKKVEHTRKKIDPDKVIRHERIPNNKPYGAPPARRRVV